MGSFVEAWLEQTPVFLEPAAVPSSPPPLLKRRRSQVDEDLNTSPASQEFPSSKRRRCHSLSSLTKTTPEKRRRGNCDEDSEESFKRQRRTRSLDESKMSTQRPPTPSITVPSAPTSASQSSSRRQTDVDSSTYRQNVLGPNGVYIRSKFSSLPAAIEEQVKMMRAQRDSPGMSDEDALAFCHSVEDAQNDGEGNVIGLFGSSLLPTTGDSNRQPLRQNIAQPILSKSVPSLTSPFLPLPPKLKTPTPDVLYGYDLNAFTDDNRPKSLISQALHTNPLSCFSRGCYYPFFAVEFKSQATGGTTYVATNQCAGIGSACVKALGQLQSSLRIGSPGDSTTARSTADNNPTAIRSTMENPIATRPTAFSAAIDGRTAIFYIHWNDDGGNYYMQEVDALFLTEPDQIKRFRTNVFNIVDHALDTQNGRLGEIKKLVGQLLDGTNPLGSRSSSGFKRSLATSENQQDRTTATTTLESQSPPLQRRRNETGGAEEEERAGTGEDG
ncbi:MAG: hypothetical protein M1823_001568 [Watsoniomyces obsoletus]|nr:MAG: hypothetical protein M1823_001568 [Watsoniomyces obsoletus]